MIRDRLATIGSEEIEASLPDVVVKITALHQEFKDKGFSDLKFVKEEYREHCYECPGEVTYSYVLYGNRLETDAEAEKRVNKEAAAAAKKAKYEAARREKQKAVLQKKKDKEYKKFLELQKKFQKEVTHGA